MSPKRVTDPDLLRWLNEGEEKASSQGKQGLKKVTDPDTLKWLNEPKPSLWERGVSAAAGAGKTILRGQGAIPGDLGIGMEEGAPDLITPAARALREGGAAALRRGTMPGDIPVDVDEEADFRKWYGDQVAFLASKGQKLHPDPYHPEHKYDYRKAWRAGETPKLTEHGDYRFSDIGKPPEPKVDLTPPPGMDEFNVRTQLEMLQTQLADPFYKGRERELIDQKVKEGWTDNIPAPVEAFPEEIPLAFPLGTGGVSEAVMEPGGKVVEAGVKGLAAGVTGLAETAGTLTEVAGRKLGSKTLQEIGETASQYWAAKAAQFQPDPEIQGSIFDNPSLLLDASWWAYNTAQMAPTLAASIIPGVGAAKYIRIGGQALRLTPQLITRLSLIGASVTGGITGGTLEGAGTYREALKQGATPEQAMRAGEIMTLASAGLNAISVNKMLGKLPPGITKKILSYLSSGATEAVTEYLEEPAEIGAKFIAGIPQNAKDIIEQLKQGLNVMPPSLLLGIFGGGAASGTLEVPTVEEAAPAPEAFPETEPITEPTTEPTPEAPKPPKPPVEEPKPTTAPAPEAKPPEKPEALPPAPKPEERRKAPRKERSEWPEDKVPDLKTLESDLEVARESLKYREEDYKEALEKKLGIMDLLPYQTRVEKAQESVRALLERKAELEAAQKAPETESEAVYYRQLDQLEFDLRKKGAGRFKEIDYKITTTGPNDRIVVERVIAGERETFVGMRGEAFRNLNQAIAWAKDDAKNKRKYGEPKAPTVDVGAAAEAPTGKPGIEPGLGGVPGLPEGKAPPQKPPVETFPRYEVKKSGNYWLIYDNLDDKFLEEKKYRRLSKQTAQNMIDRLNAEAGPVAAPTEPVEEPAPTPEQTPVSEVVETAADITDYGQITKPEMKKYLLDEIDEAIKVVKTKEPGKKLPETITIHIPGDGDFTVMNHEEALKKYREAVQKKFPAATVSKGKKPGERGYVAGEEYPKVGKGGKLPAPSFGAVTVAGPYVSDGHFALLAKKSQLKIRPSQKEVDAFEDRSPVSQEEVQKALPKLKDTVPTSKVEFLYAEDFEVLGIADFPIAVTEKGARSVARLISQSGTETYIQQKYYVGIKDVYPDAEFHVNKKDPVEGVIGVVRKGEVIGAIMPVKVKEERIRQTREGKLAPIVEEATPFTGVTEAEPVPTEEKDKYESLGEGINEHYVLNQFPLENESDRLADEYEKFSKLKDKKVRLHWRLVDELADFVKKENLSIEDAIEKLRIAVRGGKYTGWADAPDLMDGLNEIEKSFPGWRRESVEYHDADLEEEVLESRKPKYVPDFPDWGPKEEAALHAEIERRFRERTPPKTADEVLPDQRVGRGEMRRWVNENLTGKKMPETDREWMLEQSKWFKRMSKKSIADLEKKPEGFQSESGKYRITLPEKFIKDHFDRLLSPEVIEVKTTKKGTLVEASEEELRSILDDAEYYSDKLGPDEISPGLRESARATANKIKDLLGESEGEILESRGPGFAPEPGYKRTEQDVRETEIPSNEIVGDIVKRSDIIKLLSEKFDIPIRVGRYRRRRALGIFKIKPEVIRTRLANDISTSAHEVGHALNKFLWPTRRKGLSKKKFRIYYQELAPIATQGEPLLEGFAEFVSLYVTDEAKAREVAPNFYSFFESELEARSPESREILLTARKMYSMFVSQSPEARILAQISFSEAAQKGGTFQRFYTAMVHDIYPLEKIVREMTEGVELPADKDPHVLARMMAGNEGRVEEWFTDSPRKFKTYQKYGKGLRKILDPVKNDIDLLRVYLLARRHQELSMRGIRTGLTSDDANAIVDKYRSRFESVKNELVRFQAAGLRYMLESGVISFKDYIRMREANRNYVPFFRVADHLSSKGGKGRGFEVRGKPVKKIFGGEGDIIDPLESIIKNTYLYVTAAEKNAIGTAFVELANSKHGMGKYVEKIPPDKRVAAAIGEKELKGILAKYGRWFESVEGQRVSQTIRETITEQTRGEGVPADLPRDQRLLEGRALEALTARGWTEAEARQILDRVKNAPAGEARDRVIQREVTQTIVQSTVRTFGIQIPDGIHLLWRDSPIKPSGNVISVMQNGKANFYEVHPDVYRSMMAIDRESVSTLMRILGAPTRLLRAGATLSFEFMARNPFRDQMTAFVFSKYGFKPGLDWFRGAYSLWKRDQDYWDWKASGGEQAAFVSMDRQRHQKTIEDVLQDRKVKGVMKHVIKHPIDALRALSEFGEEGTRVGEFKRAIRKEGRTKAGIIRGGLASREVTLDFRRIGTQGRALNQLIAFWNANVQGLDKTMRELKNNPGKTLPRLLIGVTLPSVLLAISNHDDDRVRRLPDWEKWIFWHIPVGDTILRIPKPPLLGAIFGTIPETIVWQMMDKGEADYEDWVAEIWKSATPGFMPTFMSPFVENWANKSMFLDRPLVPKGSENLLNWYQYSPYTTETAKSLGKLMSHIPIVGDSQLANPIKIENVIRGWTGNLGMMMLQTVNESLKVSGVYKKGPPEPAKQWSDIPLIRGFVSRYPSFGMEPINKFYENYEEASRVIATAKMLVKRGEVEEGLGLLNKENIFKVESAKKAISRQRAFIDGIYASPALDPIEKRRLIDETLISMSMTAEMANKITSQLKKATKGK